MIQRVIQNCLPIKHYGWEVRFVFLCQKAFLDSYRDLFVNCIPERVLFHLVEVEKLTEGAACTVLLAEEFINSEDELFIVNCDQLVLDSDWTDESLSLFRRRGAEGGIHCFLNDHPKWSYIKYVAGNIKQVVEKEVISPIATVGTYWFKRGSDFVSSAKEMIAKNMRVKNEFYIAPTYNLLIEKDKIVIPYMVNKMVGLGTPEDLEKYISDSKLQ
jgi:dTDP-glucose pyrophosphorylase